MLVVFAVIAVLSALLLPVFANARERSRISVCLSNLPYSQVAEDMGDLSQLLIPYLKSKQVFCCPSEHTLYEGNDPRDLFTLYGSSYRFNPCAAILHQTDAVFGNSSTSYLMADWDYWHGGTRYLERRINTLYVDNHAENILWVRFLDITKHTPCHFQDP
ncbi:MAG: hypothetical protein NT023_16400 [Armatimonadetes bacterium]|nr:hypothetical protein [Armatimonadota bacterium]